MYYCSLINVYQVLLASRSPCCVCSAGQTAPHCSHSKGMPCGYFFLNLSVLGRIDSKQMCLLHPVYLLFSHPPVIWPVLLSQPCSWAVFSAPPPSSFSLLPLPPVSTLLPPSPPETSLLWLQLIKVTVGPNCSIIFHVILHSCDIKIPTMMVKCEETDAIYHSKTLCSCTLLDKVLTGNRTVAIVITSSYYILLTNIFFLPWQVWCVLFF